MHQSQVAPKSPWLVAVDPVESQHLPGDVLTLSRHRCFPKMRLLQNLDGSFFGENTMKIRMMSYPVPQFLVGSSTTIISTFSDKNFPEIFSCDRPIFTKSHAGEVLSGQICKLCVPTSRKKEVLNGNLMGYRLAFQWGYIFIYTLVSVYVCIYIYVCKYIYRYR